MPKRDVPKRDVRAFTTAIATIAILAGSTRAHAFGPRPRTDVGSTSYGLHGARAYGGASEEGNVYGIAGSGSRFVESGAMSFRGAHAVAIGLGEGIEGRASALVGWGTRLRVAEDHGPVARAGGRIDLRGGGNASFFVVELPRLELGWQAIARDLAIEAGFGAAPIVAGRRAWPGEARNLGGAAAYGPYFAMIVPWVRLEGRWTRAHARDTDTIDATACVNVKGFSLCGDAALTFGAGDPGRSWVGLLLGFTPSLPPEAPWD